MNFIEQLEHAKKTLLITEKTYSNLLKLYLSYIGAVGNTGESVFLDYLNCVIDASQHPFAFQPLHHKITAPFDYSAFGLEFMRPLIIPDSSKVYGANHLYRMQEQLDQNDNVVLFGNHQSEVDPQLLHLAVAAYTPYIAEHLIFVAGDRVLSDPLAIPFSMGCNLLCIYSKHHIHHPPELKEAKFKHNQKVIRVIRDLLQQGKKCIYVAPSGGRDRPNQEGVVSIAPFDPQSIEMFRLLAEQVSHPTHFYPLSLSTYEILPPPDAVEIDIGELRLVKKGKACFYFGEEIDMIDFPGSNHSERHEKRQALANHIQQKVQQGYQYIVERY